MQPEAIGPSVTKVLMLAWIAGFSTKSDNARNYADAIGEAASRGWLTTYVGNGQHGRRWLVTSAGLQQLESTHDHL